MGVVDPSLIVLCATRGGADEWTRLSNNRNLASDGGKDNREFLFESVIECHNGFGVIHDVFHLELLVGILQTTVDICAAENDDERYLEVSFHSFQCIHTNQIVNNCYDCSSHRSSNSFNKHTQHYMHVTIT